MAVVDSGVILKQRMSCHCAVLRLVDASEDFLKSGEGAVDCEGRGGEVHD